MNEKGKMISALRRLFVLSVIFICLSTAGQIQAATVAKIGSKGYSSIVKALHAAQNGQTVTLMKNASYSVAVLDRDPIEKKKITIDLNKKKLTIKGSFDIREKSKLTIKNGTISLTKGNDYGYINCTEQSSLTLNNCKVNMPWYGGLAVNMQSNCTLNKCKFDLYQTSISITNGSSCTIIGGTYKMKNYSNIGATGSTLTVKGGTFKSSGNQGMFAINPYGDKNSTLNIKGGNFKAHASVIFLGKNQVCNITKGKLSSTDDSVVAVYGTLNVKGGTIAGGTPKDPYQPSYGILCYETAKVNLYKGATISGKRNTAIGYSYYKGAVVKNKGATLIDGGTN